MEILMAETFVRIKPTDPLTLARHTAQNKRNPTLTIRFSALTRIEAFFIAFQH
jgi:hypothetical protein